MSPDPIDALIAEAGVTEAHPKCSCGAFEVLVDGQWWACPSCEPATARQEVPPTVKQC